ncbi:MAG TPA: isochorismatase family cysteine hydrolase [Pyrinomonadaceae bacterium]
MSEKDAQGRAVLIVDVISDFDFEDGEALFERAKPAIEQLAKFIKKCREDDVPVIYVNDPPSDGSSSVPALLDKVRGDEKGRWMLENVGPEDDETIILKPQHSGFFRTDLEETLKKVHAQELIVTGLTTDICVFFTAHDAFMRGLKVCVPEDCVAALTDAYHADALNFLSRVAEADTSPALNGYSVSSGTSLHHSADSLW